MRSILNISVPQKVKEDIETAVKDGGFATTSEFIRDLIRSWKSQQLLRDLHQSQKEIAQGKGKVLKSLKDLK